MAPSIRPDPPTSVAEKLRKNLATLRKRGASRERVQQELERAQQAFDAKGEEERKLSGFENFGALAQNVLQGASFGFSDEILSALPGVSREEQGIFKQQLKDNPAVGYGAQLAGAVLTPPIIKGAPAAASALTKAGRILAEGAIQGGLSGLGSAEGGVPERLEGLAEGASTGAAVTGTLAGLAKGAGAVVRGVSRKANITQAPILETLARTADEQAVPKARARLDRFRKLGLASEATPADVLEQGEGALRSAATGNKAVRKEVDAFVGQRANRMANRADEAFDAATGITREGSDKSIADYIKSAREQAGPFYTQAESEARVFDQLAKEMGKTPSRKFQQKLTRALNDPDVQNAIAAVKTGPTDRTVASRRAQSHAVLDAAYKELNADYGEALRALRKEGGSANRRAVRGLRVAREKLRAAIVERAPSYAEALETFADERSLLDAFEQGVAAKGRDPSLISEEIGELTAPQQGARRKGAAASMRASDVPNEDIGEFARMRDILQPISTKDKAARFKVEFGDDAYRDYLDKVIGMVELQRLRAGKGESSTIDKLLEQADVDPENLVRAVGLLSSGRPMAAALAGGRSLTGALEKIGVAGKSRQAAENARRLTEPGEGAIERLLREMEEAQQKARAPRGYRDLTRMERFTRSAGRTSASGAVQP